MQLTTEIDTGSGIRGCKAVLVTAADLPEDTPAVVPDDGSGAFLEHRDELTARAESYARGARAANTWSAYERQWRRFESRCAAAGERALPADPLTIARFLADLGPVWRPATPTDASSVVVAAQVYEREGLRPGTLTGSLAAISVAHQTAQLENPTRTEAARGTMAGTRRHPGVAPTRRRAAARREPLLEVLRLLRPAEVLADARDHALLLIG